MKRNNSDLNQLQKLLNIPQNCIWMIRTSQYYKSITPTDTDEFRFDVSFTESPSLQSFTVLPEPDFKKRRVLVAGFSSN